MLALVVEESGAPENRVLGGDLMITRYVFGEVAEFCVGARDFGEDDSEALASRAWTSLRVEEVS